jgi:DNA-binding NarL/FixJ family response regulator
MPQTSRKAIAVPLITILLVEDHTIVREGIRRLLEQVRDFAVIAEAADGREAVDLAVRHQPAIVLMDIAMPLLNGFEATRRILGSVHKSRVIILSAHSDDAYISEAIAAGASGFLVKQTSAQDFCQAVRVVHQGKPFFSPSISDRVATLTDRPGQKAPRLTPREKEILQLIAEGKANKQSAAELGIGIKIVEKHRERLMKKLDIHDTAGLTRYAIGAGIIESSGRYP